MLGNISPNWEEKEFVVYLPKEDIWFVQGLLHTSDGIALVTLASMKDKVGEFVVITNTDHEVAFVTLMEEIKKQTPAVRFEKRNEKNASNTNETR